MSTNDLIKNTKINFRFFIIRRRTEIRPFVKGSIAEPRPIPDLIIPAREVVGYYSIAILIEWKIPKSKSDEYSKVTFNYCVNNNKPRPFKLPVIGKLFLVVFFFVFQQQMCQRSGRVVDLFRHFDSILLTKEDMMESELFGLLCKVTFLYDTCVCSVFLLSARH